MELDAAAKEPTSQIRSEGMTAQNKFDHLGNASNESLGSRRRGRRPGTHRRTRRQRKDIVKKVSEEEEVILSSDEGSDQDDEKADVERKIVALQRIVPGGESLGIENLFEETAGYIQVLQGQVRAMRIIAGFFEGLESGKRKLGG